MQTTQILLIFSVTTLTVVLAVIGIYIALILKELRESAKKLAPILDNVLVEQDYLNEILEAAKATAERVDGTTEYISDNVIEPIGGLLNFLGMLKGFKQGFRPRRKKEYPEKHQEETLEE